VTTSSGQARARCSSCRAPVVYARTEKYALMPIDAEPAPGGTYLLRVDETGTVHASAVPAKLAFGRVDLHRSHYATCPNAAGHSAHPRGSRGSGRGRRP
jgi:hypothetical protein